MVTQVDLDWDKWRANYDTMTFAQQRMFYQCVAELYPHQESANIGVANAAFDLIPYPDKQVIELGGWNGRLAASMFGRGDIGTWTNYDLVEVPQACSDNFYKLNVLEDYIWRGRVQYGDVFVACHTIEHLSEAHLRQLIDWIISPWVYLEAPLALEATDWTGYAGSHKLDIGWEGVDCMMRMAGYSPVLLDTTAARLWHRD